MPRAAIRLLRATVIYWCAALLAFGAIRLAAGDDLRQVSDTALAVMALGYVGFVFWFAQWLKR